jgi:hypothetical protein
MHLDIHVQPLAPGEFGVYISGDVETELSVVVSEQFLADVDAPHASTDEVVREAVVYLLDHDPAVGEVIDLDDTASGDDELIPTLQNRLRI